jgi:hypothetical protein
MKIRPVGVGLSHAERRKGRQSEMTKLMVAFRHAAIDPIICSSSKFKFGFLLIPCIGFLEKLTIVQLSTGTYSRPFKSIIQSHILPLSGLFQ